MKQPETVTVRDVWDEFAREFITAADDDLGAFSVPADMWDRYRLARAAFQAAESALRQHAPYMKRG